MQSFLARAASLFEGLFANRDSSGDHREDDYNREDGAFSTRQPSIDHGDDGGLPSGENRWYRAIHAHW